MEPGRLQLADQAAAYLHTQCAMAMRTAFTLDFVRWGDHVPGTESELEIEDLASEVEAIPAGR